MSFLVLFGLAILVVGFAYLRTRRKASKLSSMNWDDLIGKVAPVCVDGISTIAVDYLQPTKGQLRIGTAEMWAMIGEAEGVRRMYANAEVLIALAGYAQRWNPMESLIVAERMRRDGLILRRAVLKLSLSVVVGRDASLGPFNVQEAASSYYLMRQRLLALYETSHAGRYPQLAALI
jgi:hypothetical protein